MSTLLSVIADLSETTEPAGGTESLSRKRRAATATNSSSTAAVTPVLIPSKKFTTFLLLFMVGEPVLPVAIGPTTTTLWKFVEPASIPSSDLIELTMTHANARFGDTLPPLRAAQNRKSDERALADGLLQLWDSEVQRQRLPATAAEAEVEVAAVIIHPIKPIITIHLIIHTTLPLLDLAVEMQRSRRLLKLQ